MRQGTRRVEHGLLGDTYLEGGSHRSRLCYGCVETVAARGHGLDVPPAVCSVAKRLPQDGHVAIEVRFFDKAPGQTSCRSFSLDNRWPLCSTSTRRRSNVLGVRGVTCPSRRSWRSETSKTNGPNAYRGMA